MSTNYAQRCSTSQIGRHTVTSGWYRFISDFIEETDFAYLSIRYSMNSYFISIIFTSCDRSHRDASADTTFAMF